MKRAHRSAKTARNSPRIGLVEWFRPGEYDRAADVLEDLEKLGVSELRLGICWADWYTSEGDGWYAWLLPQVSRSINILPCFLYTPPSLGVVPKFSSPPKTPKVYADFIDVMITRFGKYFEWLELWDSPNNPGQWDRLLDADWRIFCEMIGGAAYWARQRGKKTVLPGLWPAEDGWIDMMAQRGVLQYIDAVGIHGFPGSSEYAWDGWERAIGKARMALETHRSKAEVWITQTGFSTWRGDERAQVRSFADAMESPVERVYWRSLHDLNPALFRLDTYHSDERDYHFGLKRSDGTPKLLFRLWTSGGYDAIRKAARETEQAVPGPRKHRHTLITGGAGFIGTNLADRLLTSARSVLLFDNLARAGVDRNIEWLRATHAEGARVEIADVQDRKALRTAVRSADQVFHFAAQVAVTSSLMDPVADFEVNVKGTLNLLEEIRALESPPSLLFTSTNKVYGGLNDLALQLSGDRYQPADAATRSGIAEDRPLDFHSPYGCSKGAADQYVLDYARTFGVPAAVFRMSCIYGLHQMGTEDQGWVAHFLIRAIEGRPLVLYGDGMQVRDVLFADDLVDALLLAQANIHTLAGQAFNIGGGLGNTISLKELLDLIAALHGSRPEVKYRDWRPGDQRYYVSDSTKFKGATGWAPQVCIRDGVERLYDWLRDARGAGEPKRMAAGRGIHEIFPN